MARLALEQSARFQGDCSSDRCRQVRPLFLFQDQKEYKLHWENQGQDRRNPHLPVCLCQRRVVLYPLHLKQIE